MNDPTGRNNTRPAAALPSAVPSAVPSARPSAAAVPPATTPLATVPTAAAASAAPVRLGPAAAGRCRRRVHLDHAPDAPRAERSRLDAGVKMRLQDVRSHTDEVLDRLPAGAVGWSPQSGERPSVIRMPTLRTPTRIGTPDLLIADSGGYVPVIIRGHRTLDPGGEVEISSIDDPFTVTTDRTRKRRRHSMDVLQLAHHFAMLRELGLAAAVPRGGVIGRGSVSSGATDGEVIVWHDLAVVEAEYDALFADRQAVAAAAAAGGELARPSRISECRRCDWWPVCSAELEATHDISLLTAGSDVIVLKEAGLHTLDDLVRTPQSRLEELQLTSVPAGEARVRAKARLDGLPLVRRRESAAARRADVEMDIDMESYLDDGAYLWGTLLSGADIGFGSGYRPFATFEPIPGPAEAEMFVEFWAYLQRVRTACADAGLSFAAYCWSRTAEERWLYSTPRRYPSTPGMPTRDDIAAFCGSAEWVDLLVEVKQQFVVPGSMRLKAIAPIAGFDWRDDEPGGENSMAWYRAAIGDVDPAADTDRAVDTDRAADTDRAVGAASGADLPVPDLSMRQRILDYNEDDVRATAAIRAWMSDGAQALPTVAQVLDSIVVPG